MITREAARDWLLENYINDELAHYGVLGMHWGIRKKEEAGQNKKGLTKKQKIAIGIGLGALVIGGATAAFILSKGRLRVSDITPNNLETAKDFVTKIAEEPISPIHLARGKNIGNQIIGNARGGVSDPMAHFFEADPNETIPMDSIKRFGINNEKILSLFKDPDGRTDFAGRAIAHNVIVPKNMTEGITSVNDVISKIYVPHLKAEYDAFWEKSLASRI